MSTGLEMLTPFIEAAKRGCEDFSITLDGVALCALSKNQLLFLPATVGPLPWDVDPKRVNRLAACVCIEWWQEWVSRLRGNDLEIRKSARLVNEMIAKLRAFKREYGEAK